MRVRRSPRRGVPIGICGCLVSALLIVVVLAVGVVFIFLRSPNLALLVAGFKPEGSTAQVFAGQPNTPPVQLENPVNPPQAVVNLGSSGSQVLPAGNVQTGTINGSAAATVSFSENDLMNLCVQRTTFCSNTNPQYRNVKVDLQPDGGIVYADVTVPELGSAQTVGVALKLDASHRQFNVVGVDVGGTLYGLPSGELGQRVQDIAAKANELLQVATLDVSGGVYNLSDIRIDSNSITFVMR
ncbi:MAG: hypothetical protein GC179_03835 [Anaerolineaceae bacterium]|nr:hypothetical protein [Anaerolineaceae bacterium]